MKRIYISGKIGEDIISKGSVEQNGLFLNLNKSKMNPINI
jgi:hypothetical protein